ncbi:uncharacterized protein ARMOST_22143 [Armillaria ostoyae]|uniref:Uncharacterized protein n=1 Tax=Armillaria ostoyae TaxID=47428 RepID=A0A284SC54_ARMOS|nr:uncharacterized protein ARMOST_22143 [Armillaria ostoyae]
MESTPAGLWPVSGRGRFGFSDHYRIILSEPDTSQARRPSPMDVTPVVASRTLCSAHFEISSKNFPSYSPPWLRFLPQQEHLNIRRTPFLQFLYSLSTFHDIHPIPSLTATTTFFGLQASSAVATTATEKLPLHAPMGTIVIRLSSSSQATLPALLPSPPSPTFSRASSNRAMTETTVPLAAPTACTIEVVVVVVLGPLSLSQANSYPPQPCLQQWWLSDRRCIWSVCLGWIPSVDCNIPIEMQRYERWDGGVGIARMVPLRARRIVVLAHPSPCRWAKQRGLRGIFTFSDRAMKTARRMSLREERRPIPGGQLELCADTVWLGGRIIVDWDHALNPHPHLPRLIATQPANHGGTSCEHFDVVGARPFAGSELRDVDRVRGLSRTFWIDPKARCILCDLLRFLISFFGQYYFVSFCCCFFMWKGSAMKDVAESLC